MGLSEQLFCKHVSSSATSPFVIIEILTQIPTNVSFDFLLGLEWFSEILEEYVICVLIFKKSFMVVDLILQKLKYEYVFTK